MDSDFFPQPLLASTSAIIDVPISLNKTLIFELLDFCKTFDCSFIAYYTTISSQLAEDDRQAVWNKA